MTSAFLYGVMVQWKLDIRNKGVLLTYYLVPLLFFAFIGAIFSSINPTSKETLIQAMTIFGVSMGALLGAPTPLVELYGSEIVKAYKVGGIPLWTPAINNFISAFIHLMITSTFIFFVAPIAFAAKVPENVGLYFFSLAVFIMVCLSVGTALGLMIQGISKLTMVSQLIFLPSLMLSGIMFPSNLLPSQFEMIGKVFPATWGMKTMTSNFIEFKMYLPLLVIFCLATAISIRKLSRVGING